MQSFNLFVVAITSGEFHRNTFRILANRKTYIWHGTEDGRTRQKYDVLYDELRCAVTIDQQLVTCRATEPTTSTCLASTTTIITVKRLSMETTKHDFVEL